MTKKRFAVTPYYEAPVCDCGGTVCLDAGGMLYLTSPVQKAFRCNKCGAEMTLSEPDFPGIRYDVIGLMPGTELANGEVR